MMRTVMPCWKSSGAVKLEIKADGEHEWRDDRQPRHDAVGQRRRTASGWQGPSSRPECVAFVIAHAVHIDRGGSAATSAARLLARRGEQPSHRQLRRPRPAEVRLRRRTSSSLSRPPARSRPAKRPLRHRQFGETAHLDDPALVHEDDQVGVAHGGQAVGDDEGGAACAQAVDRFLDARLGLDVERAGRLVEHQDRRVLEDGAGDRDALALAARQLAAALADERVVAVGSWTG